MKCLHTIQNVFRVFQILSKIAMILSFVTAGLAAAGILCTIAWNSGGTVAGMDMETWQALTEMESLNHMLGVLLSDLVILLADGVLYLFAYRYFKAEQADGTPFTHHGADRIRRLGIQSIVLPLVAVIIAAVIHRYLDLPQTMEWSNGSYVMLGIVLILASVVFHYGAELEEQLANEGESK